MTSRVLMADDARMCARSHVSKGYLPKTVLNSRIFIAIVDAHVSPYRIANWPGFARLDAAIKCFDCNFALFSRHMHYITLKATQQY